MDDFFTTPMSSIPDPTLKKMKIEDYETGKEGKEAIDEAINTPAVEENKDENIKETGADVTIDENEDESDANSVESEDNQVDSEKDDNSEQSDNSETETNEDNHDNEMAINDIEADTQDKNDDLQIDASESTTDQKEDTQERKDEEEDVIVIDDEQSTDNVFQSLVKEKTLKELRSMCKTLQVPQNGKKEDLAYRIAQEQTKNITTITCT